MTTNKHLSETVLYGGVPVLRGHMEQALDALEVFGPARLAYGRLPAIDSPPSEVWDGSRWVTKKEHTP